MKILIKTSIIFLVLLFSSTGCTDDRTEQVTYEANVPVYMSFKEFRSSFKKSKPVEISTPGKMYFKDNYLFVNELSKGIHVINNYDPANPEEIAFYEIKGNVDMAIRGNILFADSYIDLLAIDISDISNPVEISRIENIFPDIMPEGDNWYPYTNIDKSKGVIIDWKVETVTEEVIFARKWNGPLFSENKVMLGSVDGLSNWSAGAGTGGSMARFMLNDKYLHVIAQPSVLKTIDVEKGEKMSVLDSMHINRNMETLFMLGNKMFIGTTTGMLIYDMSYPVKPKFISNYDHITACDPVVADEKYAYVTLRTGTRCANGQNLLEVIDISSLRNPYLIKSYPMFNPHGLGIDGDLLFICDGAAGLKIFDKSDPLEIINRKIAHYPDFFAFDVIPLNGILMLVGEDGIFQYKYSDPRNIVQISHIPINGSRKKFLND